MHISLVTDLKLEYKTFVLIFAPISSLDKFVLVAKSQSVCRFEVTVFT